MGQRARDVDPPGRAKKMTTPQNTATLDIVVQNQGSGANVTFRLSAYNPIVIADSPGVGTPVPLVLASGFNSVPVPKSLDGQYAQFMLLLPSPSSAIVKTLKGVTGDTG